MAATNATAVENRLNYYLGECFQSLKISVNAETVQEWVDLIYHSMMTPRRLYHNAEHVLEVLKNLEDQHSEGCPSSCDPISQLAILFHDVIYISLDKEFSQIQQVLLKDVLLKDDQTLLKPADDPNTAMVCTIFGIKGDGITAIPLQDPGRNEFLSALVAIQTFQAVLSKPQLIQLAMAIEATIPFRDPSVLHQLFQKGKLAMEQFCAATDDSVVEHAVHQAVLVANSDIGVFATSHPIAFLDSNWRLLPEWFPYLLQEKPLLTDLQTALESVLQRPPLDVTRIFVSYNGIPSPSDLEARQQQAAINLQFLQDYLTVRLLTITLIVEVCQDGDSSVPVLSELIAIEERAATKLKSQFDICLPESELYNALVHGRGTRYTWDAKESPLGGALFLAMDCSIQTVKNLLDLHHNSAKDDWLKAMPQNIVLVIRQGFEKN